MPKHPECVASSDESDKRSVNEVLPVTNSADLSPPNLASPRFGTGNSQESGTASLSNVLQFVEDHNKLVGEKTTEDNVGNRGSVEFICKQVKSKQKRKRGTTPKTSTKRQKDNEPKRLKLESTLNLITEENGTVSLESFLALKIDQLRNLSKELKLSLPSKLRKKELRQKISVSLNIQSS